MLLELTNVAFALPLAARRNLYGWLCLVVAVVSFVYHQCQDHDVDCAPEVYCPTRIADHIIAKFVVVVSLYMMIQRFGTNALYAGMSAVFAALGAALYVQVGPIKKCRTTSYIVCFI